MDKASRFSRAWCRISNRRSFLRLVWQNLLGFRGVFVAWWEQKFHGKSRGFVWQKASEGKSRVFCSLHRQNHRRTFIVSAINQVMNCCLWRFLEIFQEISGFKREFAESRMQNYQHAVYRLEVVLGIVWVVLSLLWPENVDLGKSAGVNCTQVSAKALVLGHSSLLCPLACGPAGSQAKTCENPLARLAPKV